MTREHPLIERVARAIFDADEARLDDQYRQRWDKQFSQQQKLYKARARAAIAAVLDGIHENASERWLVGIPISFFAEESEIGIFRIVLRAAKKEIGA